MRLIEVFFGIITRQAIRGGSFDSVKQLVAAIGTFIEGWNDRCHPFTWTKTADEILPHATRKRGSDARHSWSVAAIKWVLLSWLILDRDESLSCPGPRSTSSR